MGLIKPSGHETRHCSVDRYVTVLDQMKLVQLSLFLILALQKGDVDSLLLVSCYITTDLNTKSN